MLQADHRPHPRLLHRRRVVVSLTCDIRIASENAKFAVPATKLGLGYRAAGIRTLMNVVGPAFAKEIFYTGRLFAPGKPSAWD